MSEAPDMVVQVRESIRNAARDSVTKLLLGHSQLTPAQLETILVDSLCTENSVKKERRRLFRASSKHVTRGSYNRTLVQAQNNVIRSIYTILLLGYLGLFDSPALQPFIELSDTIQGYARETRNSGRQHRAAILQLQRKLSEGISELASRESFKDVL